MNSFACKYCGAQCHYTRRGYITGCEHYPPDIVESPGPKTELTATDMKLLRLLADGHTNIMLARDSNCSLRWITKWRSGISRFLGARSAFQLGMAARPYLE